MKGNIQRTAFILRYYLTSVIFFVPLRLLFMYLNSNELFTISDYIDVACNGLLLDVAVAGYLTALPLLLTITTLFFKLPVRKILLPYNILISAIIALAFTADISLYPFWEFKLDASLLIYLDSPSNAFASVTTGYIATRIVSIILSSTIFAAILHKITPKSFPPTGNKIAQTIILILLGGFIFLGIRGGVTESTNNVGKVFFSDKQFLNHSAVNPIFSFIYSMGKREDYSEEYTFFDENERKAIFDGLYRQDTAISDTLLNTTRPNIITIIFEGLNHAVIEELGGQKGITPNFEQVSRDGIFFTNCYANSYRTDRGLICALSGYPSFPKTSVMKSPIKSQSLPSFADELSKNGYKNTFLYGGDINFTNMKGYLFAGGYNHLVADKDFTPAQQKTHLWGVADHITFDSLFTMTQNQPSSPWHITFLTLSSHEPWTAPGFNKIKNDKIANAFAYTDSCFGKFIDRLKQSEIWKNTLIICLADHTVSGYPEGIEQSNKERNRIPFLLTGGAIKESKRINTICNQTDIPATILSQMQLPIKEFTFSRNILSPDYKYPFAYHSYNNGISFIDSTGFSVMDLDSRKIIKEEPADSLHNRINRAKSILQTTYNNFLHLEEKTTSE